jgi:hypothetical protein
VTPQPGRPVITGTVVVDLTAYVNRDRELNVPSHAWRVEPIPAGVKVAVRIGHAVWVTQGTLWQLADLISAADPLEVTVEGTIPSAIAAVLRALRAHDGRGVVNSPPPLGRARPLPAFPVDALPEWLGAQVRCLAEATQTPPCLPAMVGLGVASACAGGRALVEARRGWREPANLYCVVALDPGNRKSGVFAAMTAPLLDVEGDLVREGGAAITEARTPAPDR